MPTNPEHTNFFQRLLDYPLSIPDGSRSYSLPKMRKWTGICCGFYLLIALIVILQCTFYTSVQIRSRSPITGVDYIDVPKLLNQVFLADSYNLWPAHTGSTPVPPVTEEDNPSQSID